MKTNNLSWLVAEVREEKPKASVGAVRYHVRELNLGDSDEKGFRFFDENDAKAVIARIGAVGRPMGSVMERRIANLTEASGVKAVSKALEMRYDKLISLIRSQQVPVIKVGARYHFTREMVMWIHEHPDGAGSPKQREYIIENTKFYASVEEWRLGKAQ